MPKRSHLLLCISLSLFHSDLIAGGLDGTGMKDEFFKQLIWFSITLIIFFVAKRQFRKNNDRSSIDLMIIALISLVSFFIYGMIRMYFEHGQRVVPGMIGFKTDISSISFIIRGVLVIITSLAIYHLYKKRK